MGAKYGIGLDGRRLTISDLPPPDTKRWVVGWKAVVVAAVRGGLLSLEEACSLYALNFEEFRSWQRCVDHFGIKGLRTTKTQFYRELQTAALDARPPADSPARHIALATAERKPSTVATTTAVTS
jgi:hypothetical protein